MIRVDRGVDKYEGPSARWFGGYNNKMEKSIEVDHLLRNVKIMKRRPSQINTVSNGNDTPDTKVPTIAIKPVYMDKR